MDYIREFDIRLEKEMYYAGETMSGVVVLDTSENFKVKAIRVLLRGKAHTEWKVMVSGDRRTVKDDQYFIDDRCVIWGKEKGEGNVPILPRGTHQFPFRFQIPESSLPCSFESRAGTIRYYLKVTVDIPYASPPQGMKYFTVIGPHLDCMDYLRPTRGETRRRRCCLCCESGKVSLKTDLERSAYVCGESLRVRADIDNQSEEEVRLKLRLVQYLEYYIDRGVLGVEKEGSNTILEYRGAPVAPRSRIKWDSQQNLVVPTMPPTMLGVCRLIQIYYVLKVNVELEKSGEDLHMHFPITIATVPFRIPNSNQTPIITYEVACDHAEGGMYIGPEFLLGQVYDGTSESGESIVLYRPIYPTVKSGKGMLNNTTTSINNSIQSQPQSSAASTPNATKGLKVDVSKDFASILQNQQPLVHQPPNKPGTSSAAGASTASNNKSSTSGITSPSSNSNLISATPTQGTTTITDVTAASEVGRSSLSSIPIGGGGGDGTVESSSSSRGGQSTNKSLKKDPCSSSSLASVILPTVHKSGKPAAEEGKLPPNSSSLAETNNFATTTNTGPSGSSNKRTRKLNPMLSSSSTSSSGAHVSFDTAESGLVGEGGPSTSASMSKKLSKASSSSTSLNSASKSKSREVAAKIVSESGSGSSEVKCAAVDITVVSKIGKDDTLAKSTKEGAVFPGKVVKLEASTIGGTTIGSNSEHYATTSMEKVPNPETSS